MRSLAGLALLLIMIVPFFGAWQFYSHQIITVRKSVDLLIQKGIPEDQQVLLKFTEDETITLLRWEHSREFEYQGNMYDIIRSEKKDDRIWYWCHHDRKETKLKNDIQTLIANKLGQDPENRNQQNRISLFFKSFLKTTQDQVFSRELAWPHNRCMKQYFFSSSTFILSPPFPPPDFS